MQQPMPWPLGLSIADYRRPRPPRRSGGAVLGAVLLLASLCGAVAAQHYGPETRAGAGAPAARLAR
jgi:hypothetical protein